jgi:hypothetical protein
MLAGGGRLQSSLSPCLYFLCTVPLDGQEHTVEVTVTVNGQTGTAIKTFTACMPAAKDGCTAVLSSDIKLHIPMIKYQTLVGVAYIWIDMQYIPTSDGNYCSVHAPKAFRQQPLIPRQAGFRSRAHSGPAGAAM